MDGATPTPSCVPKGKEIDRGGAVGMGVGSERSVYEIGGARCGRVLWGERGEVGNQSWVFSKKPVELGKGCVGYVICVLDGVIDVLEGGEGGVLV